MSSILWKRALCTSVTTKLQSAIIGNYWLLGMVWQPDCVQSQSCGKNSKTSKRYAKISDTPFDQRSLIHREAWFPPCFVRQNQQQQQQKNCGNFRQLSSKNVQIQDHFFPLLFLKDSESLKILDI